MKLRQTHSLATLPISKAAYEEIVQKLLAVEYAHALLIRHNCNYLKGSCNCLQEQFEKGTLTIDMHGIGLVLEEENVKPQVCIICGSDQYPLDLRSEFCIVCAIKPDEEIEVKEELSKKDKNYHITETNMEDF